MRSSATVNDDAGTIVIATWMEPSPPDEVMEKKDLTDAIDRALEAIDPRERRVIELRFGLYGREHTLAEVGALEDPPVSPGRIRHIETMALRTIGRKLQFPPPGAAVIDKEPFRSPSFLAGQRPWARIDRPPRPPRPPRPLRPFAPPKPTYAYEPAPGYFDPTPGEWKPPSFRPERYRR